MIRVRILSSGKLFCFHISNKEVLSPSKYIPNETDSCGLINDSAKLSRYIGISHRLTMQSPSLHRHCPISTVLWDCPTTYHSFEILRFQLQFHTLLREMAGSPQLMCIHNVKHDWFSDSAVPHNTRHIALYDIVFRTS